MTSFVLAFFGLARANYMEHGMNEPIISLTARIVK